MYNGVWGKAPEAGEFSRIFVLKVTLQSVRLRLTVSCRKKIGEQDVLVAPPIILLASNCSLCSPRSSAYASWPHNGVRK